MPISLVVRKKRATARYDIKKWATFSRQEISIIKNPLDASYVTFTLYRRQAADSKKKTCYNTLSVRCIKTSPRWMQKTVSNDYELVIIYETEFLICLSGDHSVAHCAQWCLEEALLEQWEYLIIDNGLSDVDDNDSTQCSGRAWSACFIWKCDRSSLEDFQTFMKKKKRLWSFKKI